MSLHHIDPSWGAESLDADINKVMFDRFNAWPHGGCQMLMTESKYCACGCMYNLNIESSNARTPFKTLVMMKKTITWLFYLGSDPPMRKSHAPCYCILNRDSSLQTVG